MTCIQENLGVLLLSVVTVGNNFIKCLLSTNYMQYTLRETIMNRKNPCLQEPYSLVQETVMDIQK